MSSTTITFNYLHSTPGRMRIRVPERRGDEEFARAVEHALGAVDGITRVTANPVTGSFLIQFDLRRIDDRQILAELGRMGLQGDLVSSPATPERAVHSHAVLALSTRVGAAIGKELAKAALGRVVGGSPLNLLLLFF